MENESEVDCVVRQEHNDQKILLLTGAIMEDIFFVGVWYPKDCKVSFESKGHRMELLVEKKGGKKHD